MLSCLHVILIAYSVMFSQLKRGQHNSDCPRLHQKKEAPHAFRTILPDAPTGKGLAESASMASA